MKTKMLMALVAIALSVAMSLPAFARGIFPSDDTSVSPYDILRRGITQSSQLVINLRFPPSLPRTGGSAYSPGGTLALRIRNPFDMRRVVDAARNDLAARLRIPVTDITVSSAKPQQIGGNLYSVVLSRQLPAILTDTATAAITPQPYGTYTYMMRATGYGTGSTAYIVDSARYYDGSYDMYNYQQVESLWGTILKVATIDQYDNSGLRTARVSYLQHGYPVDRVQTVTHYGDSGDGKPYITYVDGYNYLEGIDTGESIISVSRYEGEVRLPEAEPLCVFTYRGVSGQERLEKCVFTDGTYMTYSNDIANTVYDINGKELMRFLYHYDRAAGGIVETKVIYPDGTEEILPGFADPVDIVLVYIKTSSDLVRKANLALEMLKTQNEAVLQYDSEAAVVRSQFGPINSQISEMLSKLADLGIAPPPEVMLSPMLLPPSPVTRELLAQAIVDLQAAINNGDMDAIRAILANEAFGINPDEPSVVPENIETLVNNVKWELSSMTTYLGIRVSYLEEITTIYNEYTADLIAKANGKILEYQANQAELNEQSAVTRQAVADIEAAYEEYLGLYSALPEGHPFQQIPRQMVEYPPVDIIVQRLQDEIDTLNRLIADKDYGIIEEHLAILVLAVPEALSRLRQIIDMSVERADAIRAAAEAVRAYLSRYESEKEIKGLAVKDLAARLRVPETEIQVISMDPIPTYVPGGELYTVILERPINFVPYVPLGAAAEGMVPTPFGRCTYTISEHQFYGVSSTGAPTRTYYLIDSVKYFDGSYDVYHWMDEPGLYDAVSKRIMAIDHYDAENRLRATILYIGDDAYPSDDVQRIIHYKLDGSVQYTDDYLTKTYYEGDPGYEKAVQAVRRDIYVLRYAGEVWIPEAEPLCVFFYTGPVGLERLERCDFADGTYITYSNDLASAVYDAGGRELMRFIYDFDPQAGIAYTRVVYPDGTEQQFKGMVDPVDIVVAMMSGLEIAKNHIMEVYNPDSLTFESWEAAGDDISAFYFSFPDGSRIKVDVNVITGEPIVGKNQTLEAVVLASRNEIALKIGVDVSAVHVNGVPSVYDKMVLIIGMTPARTYKVDAVVNGLTIINDCIAREISRDVPPYGFDSVVESVRLASIVNGDGIDLYRNASGYLRDELGQGELPLEGWALSGENVVFNYTRADGTSAAVYVNTTTGMAWDAGTEALRLAREDFAFKNGLNADDPGIIVESYGSYEGVEWVGAFLSDYSVEATYGCAVIAGKVVVPYIFTSSVDSSGNTTIRYVETTYDENAAPVSQYTEVEVYDANGALIYRYSKEVSYVEGGGWQEMVTDYDLDGTVKNLYINSADGIAEAAGYVPGGSVAISGSVQISAESIPSGPTPAPAAAVIANADAIGSLSVSETISSIAADYAAADVKVDPNIAPKGGTPLLLQPKPEDSN